MTVLPQELAALQRTVDSYEIPRNCHDLPSASICCANPRGHMDPIGPERLDPLLLHSKCLGPGVQVAISIVSWLFGVLFARRSWDTYSPVIRLIAQHTMQQRHPAWI